MKVFDTADPLNMLCLAILIQLLTVLTVSTNQFTYMKCKISLSYAKVAILW